VANALIAKEIPAGTIMSRTNQLAKTPFCILVEGEIKAYFNTEALLENEAITREDLGEDASPSKEPG
jgi:hypothetical protein